MIADVVVSPRSGARASFQRPPLFRLALSLGVIM